MKYMTLSVKFYNMECRFVCYLLGHWVHGQRASHVNCFDSTRWTNLPNIFRKKYTSIICPKTRHSHFWVSYINNNVFVLYIIAHHVSKFSSGQQNYTCCSVLSINSGHCRMTDDSAKHSTPPLLLYAPRNKSKRR